MPESEQIKISEEKKTQSKTRAKQAVYVKKEEPREKSATRRNDQSQNQLDRPKQQPTDAVKTEKSKKNSTSNKHVSRSSSIFVRSLGSQSSCVHSLASIFLNKNTQIQPPTATSSNQPYGNKIGPVEEIDKSRRFEQQIKSSYVKKIVKTNATNENTPVSEKTTNKECAEKIMASPQEVSSNTEMLQRYREMYDEIDTASNQNKTVPNTMVNDPPSPPTQKPDSGNKKSSETGEHFKIGMTNRVNTFDQIPKNFQKLCKEPELFVKQSQVANGLDTKHQFSDLNPKRVEEMVTSLQITKGETSLNESNNATQYDDFQLDTSFEGPANNSDPKTKTVSFQRFIRIFCLTKLHISNLSKQLISGEFRDGSKFNWKRGGRLGRGASGVVYQAMLSSGEIIAVKQVDMNQIDSEKKKKVYDSVREEVKLLRDLEHANIVKFWATSMQANYINIFMEFVPGGTIKTLLKEYGPFEENLFKNFTQQICNGISYVHSKNIVHRYQISSYF